MSEPGARYDVFFVDDDAEIHALITEDLGQIHCRVRCFARAAHCLELLDSRNCNLLITDVKMPDMDGLTLLAKARQVAPWVPVLVITGFGDIPIAVTALKLGAVDFIEKPLDRKAFLRKVGDILRENDFVQTPTGGVLTRTEKKVLALILNGHANKEIAHLLDRSLRTVELHRSHIMHKFGVDSIVELVKRSAGLELGDLT